VPNSSKGAPDFINEVEFHGNPQGWTGVHHDIGANIAGELPPQVISPPLAAE
jgi:hypothetical protein